jgi:cysteine/glycine-rich protein
MNQRDIFCKSCYGKLFGPKGYGFAAGGSGLSMDTGRAYEVTKEYVLSLYHVY